MKIIATINAATNEQVSTIGRLYKKFTRAPRQSQERQISDDVGNRGEDNRLDKSGRAHPRSDD